MELYQLKTFVTVADEGHLTRAAERLFTSQPAVSAQVKALEEELGVTLFQRTPKGMLLTPEGELLHQRARRTLEVAGEMVNEAKRLQQELVGELRVGINSDFDFLCLPELHAALAERHAKLRVSFIGGMSPQIVRDLRKGELDAGFLFGPCRYADLAVHHLAEVPMAIAAPVAWRDRVVDAGLEAVAALPWVTATPECPFFTVTQALLEPHGYSPENVVVVDNEDAQRALVRAGAGVAMMRVDDAERAEKEGYACRWNGTVPSIELQFATQTRRTSEPAIAAFTEAVLAAWPQGGSVAANRSAG